MQVVQKQSAFGYCVLEAWMLIHNDADQAIECINTTDTYQSTDSSVLSTQGMEESDTEH